MNLQAPPIPDVSSKIERRPHPSWKLALDLCAVVILAPLILPVALIVSLYIKLVSPGPILFVQSRVGHGGEDFRIYKFRTMHVPKVSRDHQHRTFVAGYTNGSSAIKKPDYQSELIPGGKLLRKLSIDELPQLLNVLQGNMSLVGPRPDLLQLDDYQTWQSRRFEVLPGMTGLWQVSGKNRLTFDQMIELDIRYVETLSLFQDLRIMAKTIVVLLWERNE